MKIFLNRTQGVFIFVIVLFSIALCLPRYATAEIEVIEAAIAKNIVDLTPADVSEKFSSDVGRLYCYTRVKGGAGGLIIHKWYYKDTLVAAVPLSLKYPIHRTYSSKKILREWKGDWRVEITKEDGSVLKTLVFTLE